MSKKVALSYGHGSNTYEDKHSKFVVVNGKVHEEHTHNAQVGLVVKRHLLRHGVQVLEVQPANGLDVPLATRTNQANEWKADLYWSIHANAASPSARGWCAFYWKGSVLGEKIAKLYAKYVKELGLPLYSNDGIYPSERGTWSDFHELRETDMIAVLTENGFMTNLEDFKYIFENKDGYYEKMGKAHAKAILEYFSIPYKEEVVVQAKPVSSEIYKVQVGAFSKKENAEKLVNELKAKGYPAIITKEGK